MHNHVWWLSVASFTDFGARLGMYIFSYEIDVDFPRYKIGSDAVSFALRSVLNCGLCCRLLRSVYAGVRTWCSYVSQRVCWSTYLVLVRLAGHYSCVLPVFGIVFYWYCTGIGGSFDLLAELLFVPRVYV